jgi:CheY-like chemotaxis protein
MAQRAHILVVDDDPDLRETLQDVLEELGYEVSSAKDGADALRQLLAAGARGRPSLILLDLQMPNMDGAQFRAEQLKLSAIADIPVAVLSGDSDARGKAAALNTAACLEKPLKLLQLLTTIPRVMESSLPAPEEEPR